MATVIGQAFTFLGIIVFTRIMDKQAYGAYSTYYAYVSILTVLVGANLYVSVDNAYIDFKNRIHEYRKSVLALSGIVLSVVLVTICMIYALLKRTGLYIAIIAVLHGYSFFVVNYRMYSANMENDYKKKQWLLIVPYALQFLFALFLVVMFPDMSFPARALGSMLGVFCCAVMAYTEIMRCKGKLAVSDDWKYALSISLPSIVMSLSYMLMQQCDKVMISDLCGSDSTAVYSAIYYLGYALTAVDQAFSSVRQVWIYHRLDENKTYGVIKMQKWYLIIMAFIITGVFMAAPEVIRLIVPASYWQYEYVIPFVIGAGMMVLYGFYTQVVLFYKKNALLSAVVLLSALVNIGLNRIFIPKMGPIAAAYTTLAAYTLLFLLSVLAAGRNQKGLYSSGFFAVFMIFLAGTGGLYFYIYKIILLRYLLFGCLLLTIAGYSFFKRNEWKALLLANQCSN